MSTSHQNRVHILAAWHLYAEETGGIAQALVRAESFKSDQERII